MCYFDSAKHLWLENLRTQHQLTLQGVKDGKKVHEWQVNRPPGKKGKAPGEAQEHGYPRHTAYVLQCGAVKWIVRVLPLHPTQLHQHHNEHDEVEQKDDTEIGHHCHIKGDVVFQPAAVEEDKDGKKLKSVMMAVYAAHASRHLQNILPLCKITCMKLHTHKSSLVPSENLP